jgi:hypothetical protein
VGDCARLGFGERAEGHDDPVEVRDNGDVLLPTSIASCIRG